jgi:Ca2+-binding EF-hand superfamily protein
MLSRKTLLIGGLALLLGPAAALTQMPGGGPPGGGGPGGWQRGGGGGGRGGGGWGGQMNMDPNERWNQMTGGKDVWTRASITDQRQTFFFDMIARQLNITNGQITKQQYLDFSTQMRQRFQGMGRGMGPGGVQQGAQPNNAAPGAGGAPQGGAGGFDPNAFAELLFKRFDKNGDGVLNYDEMPDNLKAEKDKFDTNKDGMIDLNEFKEFIKARGEQMRNEMGMGNGASAGAGGGMMPGLPMAPAKLPDEEEPKRVVYRAGKLPKELPPWFQQIDKDGDGQIGLYEWKNSGRPLDEFFKIDKNGDGFLTVEEVLRYVADQNKPNGKGPASPGGSPGASAGGPPGGGSAGPPNGNGGGPRNGGGGPRGGGRRQRG